MRHTSEIETSLSKSLVRLAIYIYKSFDFEHKSYHS